MAATKVKNRARNPPAAAKDTRREMTTALKVATVKKSIKINNPVNTRRAIVPTCSNNMYSEKKTLQLPLTKQYICQIY